ncbi:sugar transferase [Rhodococcus sp. G-MC3]|uniref:sugar transferase n=1 Tax=Rhodococcus sp. G-MC3 TaxID=3046209 RepID=UPI0024BBA049|nr:sugar transferase [Rhodococcus sp. G-MC3]MDJ0395790.1 sugar transferase [Rhodococcus sp. G-MC3]
MSKTLESPATAEALRDAHVRPRGLTDRMRVDPLHTVITVAVDVLAATIAVAEAVLWRTGSLTELGSLPWLFIPIVIAILGAGGLYRRSLSRNFLDEIGPVETAVAFATLAMLSIMLVVETEYRPGALMVRMWITAAVAIAVGRLIRAAIQRRMRIKYRSAAPTLIVGGGPIAHQLVTRMREFPEYGLTPIGMVDVLPVTPVDPAAPDYIDVPYLGTPNDFDLIARTTGAEEVIIAFAAVETEQLVAATRSAHQLGMRVWMVPRLFDTIGLKTRIEHLGGLPLMVLPHVDPKGWQFFLKGATDRVLTSIGLLLISPIFLLLMLLVRLSSPGPIFFAQERIGRDGIPFDCLKFRSMRPPRASDAEFVRIEGAAPGGVEGVDRRTKIGKIMRQTSLDELPQLLNVIRGDMSLVGPRPERPVYVDLFAMQIRRYGERHRVKAGVTGWAQVHGLRGQTSIADRAEWDNYYIENWSIWLDVKILFLTVLAVLKRAED